MTAGEKLYLELLITQCDYWLSNPPPNGFVPAMYTQYVRDAAAARLEREKDASSE